LVKEILNLNEIFTNLDTGLPVYLKLKDNVIAKITKLTLSDNEDHALYDVLTTVPNSSMENIDNLDFIYKKLLYTPELTNFITTHYLDK
jgi:hypothetical protein